MFYLEHSKTYIYQCPRAYVRDVYPHLLQLLQLRRHWLVGAVQVRDCGEGVADAILVADAEVRAFQAEVDERERRKAEAAWQRKRNL